MKQQKDIEQNKYNSQLQDLIFSNELIDIDQQLMQKLKSIDYMFYLAATNRLILRFRFNLTRKLQQIQKTLSNQINNINFIGCVNDYLKSIRKQQNLLSKELYVKKVRQIKKNKSQSVDEQSLRGGGCGTSKLEKRMTTLQDESIGAVKLPSYFIGDLVKYLNIIINKAQLASDQQQREEIFLAIQWFTIMREHFNTLCVDSQSAASVYDLIFQYVPQLLKSAVTYIRISGLLCIQILQIINDLCRILFTYFMKNNKRFLKVEDKEYFNGLISDFETQLDIETSNIWKAGAEFEITMIKAVFQSSPSNSDEGQKLFVQFLGGLVQSVLTMSPTDNLIDSLIGGAQFLYNAHKVEDLKKKYEIYYYFESLKWYLIQLIRQGVSTKRLIQLLKNGFINYIDNQNDWLLNFCWVKMIASLISYRPIISKQEISINKVEQQQKWNQLIKFKYITQLSFNTNLGRLFLSQNNQNSETHVINQWIRKFGFKCFQLFIDLLLKSLEYSPINQFSFKEKGQQEQTKIDYIYDIIFGNHQLEESIEKLNQLQTGYEQIFQNIKQDFDMYKYKKEKEQYLLIEDIAESIKEMTKQSFCIFNYNSNVCKNFLLYFERFQIILNSIIIENPQQEQLKNQFFKQIINIEQYFNEKCKEVLFGLNKISILQILQDKIIVEINNFLANLQVICIDVNNMIRINNVYTTFKSSKNNILSQICIQKIQIKLIINYLFNKKYCQQIANMKSTITYNILKIIISSSSIPIINKFLTNKQKKQIQQKQKKLFCFLLHSHYKFNLEISNRNKQIIGLQPEYVKKFEINFKHTILEQLFNERQKLIISLSTLEVNFEKINKQQIKDEQIAQQFQFIDSFINSMKNVKNQYIKVIEQINEIKKSDSKYQKNSISKYNQEGSLKILEQITRKMINQNHFKSQFIIINELFQAAMSKQESWSLKLINCYSIRYFLVDFVHQINLQKEQIEEIIRFIQKNLSALQVLESSFSVISVSDIKINNLNIVNDMLRKQQTILQQFLSQEEKQASSGQTKDQITGEQILEFLKNDSDVLQDIQSKQKNDLNLKSMRFAVAMVEQFLENYLRNPQKLATIQEQILKIYSQLNLKQQLVNEEQVMQQQPEKQRENQSTNKKIDNFQMKLMNLSNIIAQKLQKCQILLEGVDDKINLYENIQLIKMKLDYQQESEELLSLDYEANDNLNLLEHIAFLSEIQIEFNDLNIDFNQSIDQESFCAGLFQIQLNFCDLIKPNFSISQNLDQNILQKAETFFQEFLDNVKENFEDENYKVRQCYIISLISIQYSSQEQNIIKFCQDCIVQIWASEKDERVKALLKNTELLEMQKNLFSSDLKSFSKRLQLYMDEKFNKIADLEQKIYQEGDSQVRQQMHEQLLVEQQEFEDQLDNINDMAGKLDIGIQFLKEIKKNLTQLKQKIDKLQDAINSIGDDIRKLRGKNFKELLNIRKRKVLEQMQLSSLYQIYIPLTCQEWDPISGKQIENPSILLNNNFNSQDGEINEFLLKDSQIKDVLLLRGIAGSGKSRAAGKIEEFLWQKLDSKESSWIPIYVSLPTLKEPKFNLIDQALESDFHQFDKIQVKEFKEAIGQENLKIILILDSYDEMKQDCIQSNLYQTNRFQKDLFGFVKDCKQVKEQLKVIITTRTEILTSSSYQTWFYGEKLESLKEVELLGFNEDQQHKYLEEYTLLTLKKELIELYNFTKQMLKQRIDIDEFGLFWKKISNYLMKNQNNSKENHLINELQAKQIISIMKTDKIYQKISKEQIVNLEKIIMDLWGTSQFEKLIINSQIQHILTTPFMMEIVVQVLPTMTKKYSDATTFKEKFINNYVKIKLETQIEQNLIQKYNNIRLIKKGQEALPEKVQELTQQDFKFKALKIWDQLQNEKYLQKFSLVDKMQKTELLTIDDSAIVIRALMVKKLTVFDFYSTFVEFYHQHQIKKQSELGRMINSDSLMIDLFNFSQSLALNLTINELTQIKYIQKGQLTLQFVETDNYQEDEWLDAYFNDFKANGEYKKLIRSCILLTSKGQNYSFNHKSIQEFYVGHFLLKILDDLKIMDDQDFQIELQTYQWGRFYQKLKEKDQSLTNIEQFFLLISNSLLNKNKFNLSSDNFKGVLSIIKEEMKQKLYYKQKLLQILKLSSKSSVFERASSNSLFLLGYNNDLLDFQQLQKIRISDIDLDGISFYGSDLRNSEFQDVSIRSCNFNNVNLSKAKWKGIACDELHGLIGHESTIDYLKFSNDGQLLISISYSDQTLRFWNILKDKEISQYSFSDLKKLNEFGNISDCYKLNTAIFSNDDQILGFTWYLSEGNQCGSIELYAVQIFDFKSVKSLGFSNQNEQVVYGMKFSYDNKTLGFCNGSKIITFIIILENKVITLSGHTDSVNSILFTEDDQTLISCSRDKSIKIWNYKEQTVIADLQGHNSAVQNIALQPKGSLLASCSLRIIKLWNIQTYQLLFNLEGHQEQIEQLKFSSDGQTLISWGNKAMILVWSMRDGKQIRCIGKNSNNICFSSDDKLLAQQGQNEIQLWDISVGKIISFIGGQSKKIKSMCFQPGNLILASVCDGEKVIRLWNAKIQKNTSQLDGHKLGVQFVGFSPDNKIIYSASKDNTIKLWDVKEGKLLQCLNNIQNCQRIQFSKQGEFIFIEGNSIYFWYFKEGRLVQFNEEYIMQTTIQSFTIQPNGAILVWSSFVGQKCSDKIQCKLQFYDLNEKKEVAIISVSKSIEKLKFSPNGQLLVSVSSDNKAQLWDMKSYQSIVTIDGVKDVLFSPNIQIICIFNEKEQYYELLNYEGNQIGFIKNQKNMTFSPNGSILASTINKTLFLWDSRDGKQIAALDGHQEEIKRLNFSPDGLIIASQAYDKYIYLWDVTDLKFLRLLEQKKNYLGEIAFCRNNIFLASACDYQLIIIWNYKEGTQIATLEKENKSHISLLLFSPNDQILVSCDQSYYIVIWDVKTWKKIASIQSGCVESSLLKQSIKFSTDSQKIVVFGCQNIQILNLAESYEPKQLYGYKKHIKKIKFLSDCSQLVSNDSQYLVFWDCEKYELINVLVGVNVDQKQLILSNDEKKIASYVGDGKIRIYDTESGFQIATLHGHKHLINQIQFSPDNCYLASCSLDYKIILWDVNQFTQYAILEGHKQSVNQIAFSTQNCLLSSICSNSIRVWDIKSLKQISQANLSKNIEIDIQFSSDGEQLILYYQKGYDIWNFIEASEREPLLLQQQIENFRVLGFSPEGHLLINKGYYEIQMWDIKKQKQLWQIKTNNLQDKLKFNLEGNLVFLIEGTIIYIYDLKKNKKIAYFNEHTNNINCIAISADSKIFASCSNDNTIKLSYIDENIQENESERILSSYKTLAIYNPITTQGCQIQGAEIQSKIGWNLKQLFIQNGAKDE